MRKIFETVKKKLQVWHEQRTDRIEARRQAQLDAEAREIVQVMEFAGKLYVCVNGKPIFDIDIFKNSVAEVVAAGRLAYKDWRKEKLWEKGITRVSICS